jgi:hypothetical protein
MVEINKDKQRRFGWYRPKPDGKLDIQIFDRALDDEDWEEFLKFTKAASDFRPFMIDHIALKTDFEAVSSVNVKLANELSILIQGRMVSMPEGIEAQAEVQRLLTNFLGTASAFRDRAVTRLRRRFGKESKEALLLKAKMSELFDRSFEYRALYALRNHAQHHENPISMVPINANRDAQGKMVAEVSLQLDPRTLAANPDINAKVRTELKAMGDELIDLLPVISEFMIAHDEIMLSIIEMHMQGLTEMAYYAATLYRVLNIPMDVVPVVWEGSDPQSGPQTQDRCFMCGFDELAKIAGLAASLRGENLPT